jgi:proline iminopeptidase
VASRRSGKRNRPRPPDAHRPGPAQSISFDQRGCGRSRPLVTERLDLLDTNTTTSQIEDIEALRRHLGIDRWTVTGGSWGATLAFAYAQAHPERVAGIALLAVTNTSTEEVEWVTEAMGRVFPEEWERFAGAVARRPGERIVDAYARALRDPDAATRSSAAEAWGRWEDVHVSLGPGWEPDPRWQDPRQRDVLATLVTHYWSHSGFGGDQISGAHGPPRRHPGRAHTRTTRHLGSGDHRLAPAQSLARQPAHHPR